MSDIVFLILLLTGVVLSITALGWLNRRMGGWTPTQLTTLTDAARALETDIIDFTAGEGGLSADGQSAYVKEDQGPRLGFVIALGDRWVTRAVHPDEIRAIEPHGETVRVLLKDWTVPEIVLVLSEIDRADLIAYVQQETD